MSHISVLISLRNLGTRFVPHELLAHKIDEIMSELGYQESANAKRSPGNMEGEKI